MKNIDKLSALDVKDEDLVMMVSTVASRYFFVYITLLLLGCNVGTQMTISVVYNNFKRLVLFQ